MFKIVIFSRVLRRKFFFHFFEHVFFDPKNDPFFRHFLAFFCHFFVQKWRFLTLPSNLWVLNNLFSHNPENDHFWNIPPKNDVFWPFFDVFFTFLALLSFLPLKSRENSICDPQNDPFLTPFFRHFFHFWPVPLTFYSSFLCLFFMFVSEISWFSSFFRHFLSFLTVHPSYMLSFRKSPFLEYTPKSTFFDRFLPFLDHFLTHFWPFFDTVSKMNSFFHVVPGANPPMNTNVHFFVIFCMFKNQTPKNDPFLTLFWRFLAFFGTFWTLFSIFARFSNVFLKSTILKRGQNGVFGAFLGRFLTPFLTPFWDFPYVFGMLFGDLWFLGGPKWTPFLDGVSFFVKNDVFSKKAIFGIFGHFLKFFHFFSFDPTNC